MHFLDPYDPNNPYNAAESVRIELESPQSEGTGDDGKGLLYITLIAAGFYFVYAGLSRFFAIPIVRHALGAYWLRGCLVLMTVAGGWGASWFKKANQKWYGRVEVGFGIGSCISIVVMTPIHDSLLLHWSTLVGCAYVVSRGLNNISDAKPHSVM